MWIEVQNLENLRIAHIKFQKYQVELNIVYGEKNHCD